jgi:hypothetical protein
MSNHNVLFSGIELPGSFQNEDWVAAVLFILFLFGVFAFASSRQFILAGIVDLFKRQNDNYLSRKLTYSDFFSRILLLLNTIGVFSLFVYSGMSPTTDASVKLYVELTTITAGFLVLKYLSIQFVGFIFLTREQTRQSVLIYFRLLILSGLLLYPVLVLKIYFLNGMASNVFNILAVTIVGLLFIFVTIKIFQIFYLKILDFFYILLYLCTLEILPFTGLFQVYELLIRNLNF